MCHFTCKHSHISIQLMEIYKRINSVYVPMCIVRKTPENISAIEMGAIASSTKSYMKVRVHRALEEKGINPWPYKKTSRWIIAVHFSISSLRNIQCYVPPQKRMKYQIIIITLLQFWNSQKENINNNNSKTIRKRTWTILV